ncbi:MULTISPECIES: hypothetical protein [unclassified Streptomyces]|uniref:hypothetical protein n=1 Tax=unclassified Streptomyces TaxID=2593676 RepID=UPI001F0450BD|nr:MULTISPECIES: hypothetical protein [unclassified Streptomyces]MCH0564804.1 hypothetical protein [Streptomyces sp. MUM 2J]MCH0569914.1 hypothetical protein [Streptomyces sp. MUM 136J]
MHLRTTLGTVIGAGALLTTVLASTPAQASPAGQVRPLSGCRFVVICGTLYNNTTHNVKVCLNWVGSGPDQAYQTSGHCRSDSIAYAKPHSVYGTPQHKDIDAFYIPWGTVYWGAYSGIPKKWTHTGNGWWKFSSVTDVHIDWTS